MAPLRVVRHWLVGDRGPLTEDERRMVLRAMVAIAIPLATLTLLVAAVGGLLVYIELRDRARENAVATEQAQKAAFAAADLAIRLDDEQRERETALAQQAHDNCVENENQDAANVALFRKVKALISQGPPSRARDELIDALDETSNAREPPNETDCEAPQGVSP